MQATDERHVRSILLRYSVVFLSFALLVVLTYVPIYMYISSSVHATAIATYTNIAEKNLSILDANLSAIYAAQMSTHGDPKYENLKYNREETDPWILNSLPGSINYLLTSHSLIADAAILFSNGTVVSRMHLYLPNEYFAYYPTFLSCQDLTYDEWRLMLASSGFHPVRTYTSLDYGVYEAITYSCPWSYFSSSTISGSGQTYFVTLPVKALEKLFLADLGEQSWLRLINPAGKELYTSAAAGNAACEVITLRTEQYGIQVEIGVPRTLIDSTMQPVHRMMISFGSIMLGILLLLSMMMIRHVSQPMYMLLQALFSSKHIRALYASQQPEKRKPVHEYRAIANTLLEADGQMEQYQQSLEQQQERIRHQVMDTALLIGLYSPKAEEQFERCFPDFPDAYRLAVITCEEHCATDDEETAGQQLQNLAFIHAMLSAQPDIIHLHEMNDFTYVLILPADAQENRWHAALEQLCSQMNHPTRRYAYHISETYRTARRLVLAWASVCSDHHSTLLSDPVDTSDKLRLPLSMPLIQILYSALSNGNYVMAANVLEECIAAFPQEENTMLVRHTRDILLRLLVQLKLEKPDTLFSVVLPFFEQQQTPQQLPELFLPCFRQICDCMQRALQPREKPLVDHILHYINQHLDEPTLCIDELREVFGVSASTLQKVLKEATGHSVSAHIEHLRMAHAYKLLQARTPVQDVARQCGFASHNSFFKAFKRYYGQAPNQINGSAEE